MPEERFDLVNESGLVIGSASRRECHSNAALLHPVVHVVVTGSGGCLLLQKRHPDKDIQPNRWDTSVGGHIHSGESAADAVLREVHEEIGLTVTSASLTFCYTYIMRNEIESEFVTTYTLAHNGPFRHQAEEITELSFWPVGLIQCRLGKNIFTPNFEEEFERFQKWRQQC